MKLNLGCGGDVREGWTNVDLYADVNGVERWDVRNLPVEPGTVDEIAAIDVLEHISHVEAETTLRHWAKLLQEKGRLTIRCPDAQLQAQALLDGTWDWQLASHMIFGAQDRQGNEHRCCFTMGELLALLERIGLRVVRIERHGTVTGDLKTSDNPNLSVVAVKP